MIKTIIFDIDNTLYSYDRANEKAMKALFQYCSNRFGWKEEKTRHCMAEAQEEMTRLLGKSCAAVHNRLIRFQVLLEREHKPLYPHAQEMHQCYWDTLLACMEAEPGMNAFLFRAKKRGIQIGIGTDMTADIQYEKLKKLQVLPAIDFIVTSEEVGAEKPEPKFFARCLSKAGCHPSECLMIGDSIKKDIEGARGVGMKALWYHPGKPEEDNRTKTMNVRTIQGEKPWSFLELLEQSPDFEQIYN